MNNCPWCEEGLQRGEALVHQQGLVYWHHECLFRATVGSAAHILKECSCFGGEREDPPGMSKREAAKLALEVYRLQGTEAV